VTRTMAAVHSTFSLHSVLLGTKMAQISYALST
jgi:hypothetical protein